MNPQQTYNLKPSHSLILRLIMKTSGRQVFVIDLTGIGSGNKGSEKLSELGRVHVRSDIVHANPLQAMQPALIAEY